MRIGRLLVALALGIGLALLWVVVSDGFAATAAPQPSGTTKVSGTIYRVDANANGGTGTGLTWTNAFTNLQDALDSAASGDEIWVAAGVYTPTEGTGCSATFLLTKGVALYGGFAATETARSERDWGANLTVLSGDLDGDDTTDPQGVVTDTNNIFGINACHVVAGRDVTETARLDGFVVTAGNASGEGSGYSEGGGMHNENASPTLVNLTFSGNHAAQGGGMFNDDNDFEPGNGGSSNPTLEKVVFIGNSADSGAGMYNQLYSSPVLTDVVLNDNAAASRGGGLYNDRANPKLTAVTVDGNSASNGGGGMFNAFESNPELTNVIFSENSAANGGAMSNANSSPVLTNVTFGGNSATTHGGAVYNKGGSSPQFVNCILWGNSSPDDQSQVWNDNPEADNPVFSHSDIQGCGGSGEGSWELSVGVDGEDNIDQDPHFVDAEGPDRDLHLKNHSSPCVDTGTETGAPDDDVDGEQRPAAFGWDIGADELVMSPGCYNFKDVEGSEDTIGMEDIQFLASHWRESANPPYDADGDGTITIVDLMRVVSQWGQSCP